MTRYEHAGVRGQGNALSSVAAHLSPTFAYADDVEVLTTFGHYASVLKLSDDVAIALATDGVGSKTMIASAIDRYDTIGFDCVAMNVNDVICVGARPIALVDYVGVHTLDPRRMDDVLKGLAAAAKEAGIAIPGGEIAQLPGVIGSADDVDAFDLVGACVGILHPERVVVGADVQVGDALIGIASSGIHSNGLTLARTVLLDEGPFDLYDRIESLGRGLAEELLEPTEIYVRAVRRLWDEGVTTRGLVHVTGDGFANLCRLEARVGYTITDLPDVPAIFQLIQETGSIEAAEMYRVFNMGIGFVVAVPSDEASRAVDAVVSAGYRAQLIGVVTDAVGEVRIEPVGIVGRLVGGESEFG